MKTAPHVLESRPAPIIAPSLVGSSARQPLGQRSQTSVEPPAEAPEGRLDEGQQENHRMATTLRQVAELLTLQGANPFRVAAYRSGADTLDGLERGARQILDRQGPAGLVALPGIGTGLAAAIQEMLRSGRLALLARLRGATEPEQRFRHLPGIGPTLAHRLHETLQVDTLEALEAAAHEGRLEQVPGIGDRRAKAIRDSLAGLLGRRWHPPPRPSRPAVAMLLDVDRQYLQGAGAGTLPTILPRRMNTAGEHRLPILHTERDGFHFTALFSNTPLAHRLHRTDDWVVIYFYDHDHREGQATVVTETHGPLTGQRVVRGREVETAFFYAGRQPPTH